MVFLHIAHNLSVFFIISISKIVFERRLFVREMKKPVVMLFNRFEHYSMADFMYQLCDRLIIRRQQLLVNRSQKQSHQL